jgi:hypothetical protein
MEVRSKMLDQNQVIAEDSPTEIKEVKDKCRKIQQVKDKVKVH